MYIYIHMYINKTYHKIKHIRLRCGIWEVDLFFHILQSLLTSHAPLMLPTHVIHVESLVWRESSISLKGTLDPSILHSQEKYLLHIYIHSNCTYDIYIYIRTYIHCILRQTQWYLVIHQQDPWIFAVLRSNRCSTVGGAMTLCLAMGHRRHHAE